MFIRLFISPRLCTYIIYNAGIYRFSRVQDWRVRWPLQDDSHLLIGYRVSQTTDVISPRVAVTISQDPHTGHCLMTHPPCSLARLPHWMHSPIHNRSHLLTSYLRNINVSSIVGNDEKSKKKNMTELILYIFGKGKSSPKVCKCDVIKTAATSSKFHLCRSSNVRLQLDFSRRIVSR